jgi:dTDP-4-dehydrorhamnose 3,5-epimerase-like enzyme
MKNNVQKCKLIDLPKMTDPRGNLTFIEEEKTIPFPIKRVFYIYDVPTGESRGAHAHHKLEQFLICISGSFDVDVDDGYNKKKFHLNRPWQGLYVPPLTWAAETNFDPGSVCVVLVSDYYDEKDYIRNYDEFLKTISN